MKRYEIGDNVGFISTGNMRETLTQMSLSAKHTALMAEVDDDLRGEAGFRQFIESPGNYPNRKVLCEVMGVITCVMPAPHGGKIITIRQTRPVPDRYIVHALKNPQLKQHWDYFVPPQLKVADGVEHGVEVWPGMLLSTGVDNLRDAARLRSLGFARSVAAQNMYDVYKNTGVKLDRCPFELLARASNPYVRIVKAPREVGILPGEKMNYQTLANKVKLLPIKTVSVMDALGKVLGEGVLDLPVGTEHDAQAIKRLEDNDVKNVIVGDGLEIEAVTTPISRVVNESPDWLASLNQRYLKTSLKDVA